MTEARRGPAVAATARRRTRPGAFGNSDQSRARAPLMNGAATLVPRHVIVPPDEARLVISCPGAPTPCCPIERPRFEDVIGRPARSQATTGITHGCRVMAELATVLSLPAAATTSTSCAAA